MGWFRRPPGARGARRLTLTICHITAPARYGGLEAVVAALARGMAERGHRVRILALVGPAHRAPAFEPLAAAGVELTPIPTPPRRYRAEIELLARELSRDPGAIAHTHGYHADLVGWRSARRAGVPVVSTVHGFTGGDWKNRLYEGLDRRALRRFDAVVAVSEPLRASLARSGISADKLLLLVNAAGEIRDPRSREASRRLLGLPQHGLIAAWIGRLSPEKGPDLFLAALRRSPAWKGSLLGDGVLRGKLEAGSDTEDLRDRVWWHGAVPDAATFLNAFDAVVLSSRTEGTPVVLLEAMAAGIPVVATRVGGIPHIVSDAEAFLVPPENPAAISDELERIARDPAGAAARAAAARSRLRREHSPEAWLDGYEQLYLRLGARKG